MPLDVTDLYAIKVDSGADLDRARAAYALHDRGPRDAAQRA